MSTDSMFVHKMWQDDELSKRVTKGKRPFPMLSDGGGNVGKMYGVYDEAAGLTCEADSLSTRTALCRGSRC